MDEQKNAQFDDLTDEQKLQSAKVSYLSVDENEFERLKEEKGKVTLADLEGALKNPDEMYLGEFGITINEDKNLLDLVSTEKIAGGNQTNAELLDEMNESGFGDCEVLGVENHISGLQAIILRDSTGEVLVSVRGTDVKNLGSSIKDIMADANGYFRGGSIAQLKALEEICQKYASYDKDGQVSLSGHSLGGFLVENELYEHPDIVEKVISVNALHVEPQKLENNPEAMALFNSDKFEAYTSGGDPISLINDISQLTNNIIYVHNTGEADERKTFPKYLYAHLTESFSLDENGKFVEGTQEQVYENYPTQKFEKLFDGLEPIKGESPVESSKSILEAFSESVKKIYEKVIEKIKEFIEKNRNQEETKMLPPGEGDRKPTAKELMDAQKQSFEAYLNPENWVDGVNYTKEDLAKAKEVFKDPTKDINKDSQIQGKNPNEKEDEMSL